MAGERFNITAGNAAGTAIALENELVIGRSTPGLGSLGGDSEISRVHARVYRDAAGQLMVEDLGSTNGTFVNGNRISAAQPLRPGDQLKVGQTTMSVEGGAAEGRTTVGAVVPPPAAAQTPSPAAGAAQPPTEQLPPQQPGYGQQPPGYGQPPGGPPPYGAGPGGGGGTNRNLLIAIAAVVIIALIVAGLAIGGVFSGSKSKSKTTAQTTPTTQSTTAPTVSVPTITTPTDTTPADTTPSTTGFPPSAKRTFVNACVNGGASKSICTCTIDKLESRFSFADFISQSKGKISSEARNAARQCASGQ